VPHERGASKSVPEGRPILIADELYDEYLEELPDMSKVLVLVGGAERDRTVDLLNAIQALSQLSYGPNEVDAPGAPGHAG
jgi:hypothetical protein